MSSATWNAMPMSLANVSHCLTSRPFAPPSSAPVATDTSSNLAVLCVWIHVSSSSDTPCFASHSRSMTWPPARPTAPTASPSRRTHSTMVTGGTSTAVEPAQQCSNDVERSASPARIATSSPKTTWFVGEPRRMSSSSIAGRSSWISDMVWIISIATAVGIACASVPPNISHAAMHITGRTRLPPASSEYRMLSTIFFVSGVVHWMDASRAASTAATFLPK
mmetsp:Transcript_12700/g.39236  ORF Transcript_12700/g.39236 Transcript_12700/m.39236 type:complete len:221 (-) Transcript_12700:309-971(-)